MRSEFPVDLDRAPVDLAPDLKFLPELLDFCSGATDRNEQLH